MKALAVVLLLCAAVYGQQLEFGAPGQSHDVHDSPTGQLRGAGSAGAEPAALDGPLGELAPTPAVVDGSRRQLGTPQWRERVKVGPGKAQQQGQHQQQKQQQLNAKQSTEEANAAKVAAAAVAPHHADINREGEDVVSRTAAGAAAGAASTTTMVKGEGGTAKTRYILPRIFVLGAQKGGSSSLYELLMAHPQFCGGIHKEPMFFKEDDYFKNGKDWYASNYVDKRCKGKTGTFFVDGSTMLHRMPGVTERMDQFYSDEIKNELRFIALLREPVSRDFSWYQHYTRWYLEDHGPFSGIKTLQEHAETSKGNHFNNLYTHGEYAQQLKAFLGKFRRDQILVINSNMCFKDSPAVMRIIAKFLDVPFVKEWEQPFPHEDHLGNLKADAECVTKFVPKLDCSIRDELGRWYEPKNRDLEQLMASTKSKAPPMEPAFIPFKEDFRNSSCVQSARAELDKLIKAVGSKEAC